MQINLSFDPSVSANPNEAAFEAALNYAAGIIDALIANPITVTIDVGWNEVDGQSLPSNDLAAGGPIYGYNLTYAQLMDELEVNDTSLVAQQELDHLPVSNAGTYFISAAQAKAWGIEPPDTAGADGAIGFGSGFSYDYNTADRAINGEYDIVGIALHEITHAIGRTPTDGAFELTDFAAPGVLAQPGSGGYYSVIDGFANLGNFDTTSDPSDWALPGYPNDSFNAYAMPGTQNDITYHDDQLLSTLGFDINGLAQPTPSAITTPSTFRLATGGDYTLVGKGNSIGFFNCQYEVVDATGANQKVIASGTSGLTVTDEAANLGLYIQSQTANMTIIDWRPDAQLYLWPVKAAGQAVITSDGFGGDYLSGFVAPGGSGPSSVHFVNGTIQASQIHVES